jgi:hypothetical protein
MILNLLLSVSFAATLLVKTPKASPHDYFIYAQNNEVEKISSHFLKCDKSVALRQTFKQAQYHFLNGSLEKSHSLFKEISEQKWDCDWKDEDRKIISFSYFRLAQLSKNEIEQIQQITDAINFDDSTKPDQAIFPPPVFKLYTQVHNELKKHSFSWPAFAKNYSYVLRNGQFISLSSPALETYSLRARYTFVSDSYKLETFTMTFEEILNRELEPRPWVVGDCHSGKIDNELLSETESIKIFYDNICIEEVGKPSSIQNLPILAASNPLGAKDALSVSTGKRKSWLQRNYLWVGAFVVGSLVIANQVKHSNESSQTVLVPTTTYMSESNSQ